MSEEGRPGFEWRSLSRTKQFAGARWHLASSERLIDSPLLSLTLRDNAGPRARASERAKGRVTRGLLRARLERDARREGRAARLTVRREMAGVPKCGDELFTYAKR